MLGLFITGLGIACLYPLKLSLAIGSANRNTVRAGSISSLASGVAIFSLPLILGGLLIRWVFARPIPSLFCFW
jgi:hypothetical protein